MEGLNIKESLKNEQGQTSLSQRGFFFAHQLFGEHQPLNTGLAIELVGVLDLSSLKRSLDALVERHSQLRTTFHVKTEGVVSNLHEISSQFLEVVDFTDKNSSEKKICLERLENSEISYPFDLTQLPLLRVTLVKLSLNEHCLIIVNHHVTGDGTSLFDIYLNELSQLYQAYCQGEDNPLPTLKTSFDDFIKDQQNEQNENSLQRSLKFWLEQLKDAAPHIEIPTDNHRPISPTGAGGRVEGHVYQDLKGRIAEFSQNEELNPIAVLLGSFFILLYRITNQSDMVVGLPVANRNYEYERVFGPLLNTLPIRAQLSKDMTFIELVTQIQQVSFRAIMRGNIPFETIVKNKKLQHDPSRSPIHQIVFNYMTFSAKTFQLHGLETKVRRLFPDAVWLDLIIEAEEQPEGLVLSINYNSDVYSRNSIERMISSYHLLLDAGLKSPDTQLIDLPLHNEKQLEELTVTRNDTWCNNNNIDFIHKAFEAQVALTPNAIAVSCDGRTLTYSELDSRSNCLANKLREFGVEPEQIVGLCVSRNCDMLVGLLGILKAGAAYLPLDPKYPHERLIFMMEDSSAAIIITTSDFEHVVEGEGRQLISLDTFDFEVGNFSQPVFCNKSSDLAYVIYTSGSTGQPKGVMVEHRNVDNFLLAMDRVLDFNPSQSATWVAVTSISFDISVLEIFWSLTRGLTIALKSDDISTENSITSLILEHKANYFQCTPSQARMFLAEKNADVALAMLDKLLLGGEALPIDLAAELYGKVRGEVINVYGPTETTVWSAFHCINEKDNQVVPIGKPIANTTLYVLDKKLQPVLQGVIGELFIGGEGVTRGYLGRESLTSERFLLNPFRPGKERMYRTGDLVRYRENGCLQFMGRTDHQVKLRGHRIEMGEVENYLLNINGVKKAVTVVREDIPGDQKLIAYLVVTNAYDEAQTRKTLSKSVPVHLIPNLFVTLDELPLTANGKIDRKALPDPKNIVFIRKEADILKPRNDTELRLSIIWQEILGIEQVDVRDSFFDLGGHSILSLQLAYRIETEFKSSFGPAKVFLSKTIEEQANVLLNSQVSATKSALVTLQKNGDGAPIFCLCGIHLYQELAQLMGQDQPFFAMYLDEEVAFLSKSQSSTTIKDLARVYYDVIRAENASGPIRLLGFCFGGALAYEVALLAEEDGIKVDALILLDTVLWTRLKRRNLLRAINLCKKIIKKGPAVLFEMLSKQRNSSLVKKNKLLDDETRVLALISRMMEYSPSSQLKAQTFIISSDDPGLYATWKLTHLLGWEELLLGDVTRLSLTGNHTGILQKPMVEKVASQLRLLLSSNNTI